jgi:DNA mismatch repair protein MutS2
MEFIPADASNSIEFDKVIELLHSLCIATPAKEMISESAFMHNVEAINKEMHLVKDHKYFLDLDADLPLAHYESVEQSLKNLSTEGYVLELEEIREIQQLINIISEIDNFYNSDRQENTPHLWDLYNQVDRPKELRTIIPKVINEEGEVRENASPELSKIYKSIRQKENNVQKEFNGILLKYKQQGLLTDSAESFRNGRRVLSIPAEYKRKIKGIIHDESGTGKTSFIEPESVVYLNNEIMELELEKRKEIYKILKELCHSLRNYGPLILQYEALITKLDTIRSKARLAVKLDANMPKLVERPCFKLIDAYHPLLFLKNSKLGIPTIPMTLELDQKDRIFLISGPNAGGKSVSLKTVGLIQLMVQFGCLVPVSPDSKIGLYKQLCCDIGDQQSLEDDLSTYSSRLKNMKAFLDYADEDSLILIDEFGSGTDPKMGGSIAQSILFELNKKKVNAVITTHYSNLKVFAFKSKGIVNGAMHFDNEKLQPTYELIVGKPGSSFAFEIAEKVGLPKKLLHFAKKNAGKNLRAMDKMITDLQTKEKALETKLFELKEKEKLVDRLSKNYQQLQRELEIQRKKFKKERKEFEINDKIQDKRQLEKLVKELREEQNLEKAKQQLEIAKAKQKKVAKTIEVLNDELIEVVPSNEKPEIGDHVRTRSGSLSGVLLKIQKKEAIIQMGNMELRAPLADCVKIAQPMDRNSRKRVNTYLKKEASSIQTKLDIRGYRKSEALLLLEEFLDDALISNNAMVQIVHGIGNGVLKKTVRQKLKEYKDVTDISSPPDEQGGEGVTWVKF